jgi:tetratricopeptide (TPR) repeat protein
MRVGMELNPRDSDIVNNLAYTLAAHLDRAEDAVPLADHAHELSPANANILDTLGMVYEKTGRAQEAEDIIWSALTLDAPNSDKVVLMLRLIRLNIATGDRGQAQDLAAQVRTLLRADRGLEASHKPTLDALQQQLN